MAFRKLLLSGAAAAAFAVALPLAPGLPSFVSPALADVDVSIGVGTFYDRLAPYGDWVSYSGGYVFVPAAVPANWRPYTRGHWEYTRRYGWVWVSDEPFGWAAYHYGRWGFASDIGWYWVPGTRWAPAWVEWRRSNDYVAWSPLPPEGDDIAFNISVGPRPVPDHYWAVVPAQNFLSVNLAINLIDRDDEVVRVVKRARPIGRVRVENNVVVNNIIDVGFVEKRAKKKVKVREIREVRSADQAGKADENSLAVFNPKVEKRAGKPKRAETVEQVVRKRKAAVKQGTTQEATEGHAAEQPATGTEAKTLTKKQQQQQARKKKGQQTGAAQEATEGEAMDQPATKTTKKKKKVQETATEGQALQSQDAEATTQQQKKKAARQRKLQKQQLQEGQSGDETGKAKKKKQQQSLSQPDDTQAAPRVQKKRQGQSAAKQQQGSGEAAQGGEKKQPAAAAQEETKKKKKPVQQ